MSISKFDLPLDKISIEVWGGYSEEQKRKIIAQSIAYITKRIQPKILTILLHDFAVESKTQEGVSINFPVFINPELGLKERDFDRPWNNII